MLFSSAAVYRVVGPFLLISCNLNHNFFQTQPVIWYENEPPGQVVILTAKDYDSPENGPPFTFALNESAAIDIRSKFLIQGMVSLHLELSVYNRTI